MCLKLTRLRNFAVITAGLLLGGLVAGESRAEFLYVANEDSNTIGKFTSSAVGSVFANTGLNQPFGLAFDSAGNLYAANYGGNTIEKIGLPVVLGSVRRR